MDVVEEEYFFKWKEDVQQEYPGKGQALFQVCTMHGILMILYHISVSFSGLYFESLALRV